jgi:GDP/UDP-N,N'-diacetylbacillosamine 2-epimerase (hydrolysing)
MIIGNSSSGIYEAPFFKIPTINVGNRQQGRLHGGTVINCNNEVKSIVDAICMAFDKEFRNKCKQNENLFGDGKTADRIIQIIKKELKNGLPLTKKFYDIEFDIRRK